MEKLLRLFLSLLCLGILISCENEPYHNLSQEERKQLSRDLWFEELNKHGFNGAYQGTPLAATLLDSILSLDSLNCDALREVSIPYLKRGLPHEWKPLFDKAIECDAAFWQPWRGYLYLFFYRAYDKAIADFNASDTLTPNSIDAPQGHSVNYWRGVAYLGKSDYHNSIKYFKTHIAASMEELGEEWIEASTFLYLGIAQYELKQFENAQINLNKMLKYNYRLSADASYYLALISRELGEVENAKLHLDTARASYNKGYFRSRDYVEEIRQIYIEDFVELDGVLGNSDIKTLF